MKRNLFFAALAAVALSGCSKNEVTEALSPSDNINTIGMSLATGLSRGVETNTALVEKSNEITLTYNGIASVTELNSGEAVNGNLTMEYDITNDVWNQTGTDKMLWSQLTLPASFYSMHAGGAPLTATGSNMIEADYSYEAKAVIAEQEDLVYYAGSIRSMPAGGYIRGNFHHALSRVEIYSNQGSYNPFIMNVDLMNVKKSGVAKLTVADGICAWTPNDEPTSYNYLDRTDEKHPVKTTNGQLITDFDVNNSPAPVNNMIVIPQTLGNALDEIKGLNGDLDPILGVGGATAETVKTASAYTEIDGSYIKVLYRMLDAAGKNSVVGYFAAKDCAEYIAMKRDYDADPENATPVLPSTIGDDSHLYVLVGFPFSDDQKFEVSKDYDLQLGLGINGGYLLYEYFFDVNGDPTNIRINGLDAGDPIINEKAPIGIMVTVKDWLSAGNVMTE